MLLADKIIALRKKCGWSQEELADQLKVSRQSVSKWESGMSVPDMNKIVSMSRLFGVSTDYLLKEEIEQYHLSDAEAEEIDEGEGVRMVIAEQANEFMDLRAEFAGKLAAAVAMFILSPALLLFLAGMTDAKIGTMSENLAAGVGVVVLLLIVAAGVAILIFNSMKLDKYEYLETEGFALQYGAEGIVLKRKEAFEPIYRKRLTLGIVLCIVSPIPIIITAIAGVPDFYGVLSLILLLVFVSGGTFLIISVTNVWESFEILLQTGDYTKPKKKSHKRTRGLAAAYWSAVVCIYLGWSMWTNEWGKTWIVWVCAGVLYGAFCGLATFWGERSREP